ncbi:MAG: glycosyltransferase [Chloroflexi bacterium]|nr:glycosyltransferase [Chloroflexota bacterium]
MAKVLFLTQVLPWPLDAGPKVRAHYVLRWLAQQHALTLVSFVREDTRPEDIATLRECCGAVHTAPMRRSLWRNVRAGVVSLLTRQPVIILRDDVSEMRALIRRLVTTEQYDVIHADQTSMVQYALFAQRCAARRWPGAPPALVLDAHNALFRVPERLAAVERNPLVRAVLAREACLLSRYESAAYRRFDQVVFVTDVDRQLFAMDAANVIPICADPADTAPVQRGAPTHMILHLGTMFWPPNIEGVHWFVREVLPLVRARVPDARFAVVGKNPPASVAALTADPGVQVTGYVPDPEPYLAECAAFIVPLNAAGGMRVKIVDAWCWGVPIVSTTIGAEGIEVRAGENVLLADAPADFADAVVALLLDPARGRQLAENGRRWVLQRYAWTNAYRAWDAVYAAAQRANARV